MYKELLEYIIKSLVVNKDAVTITELVNSEESEVKTSSNRIALKVQVGKEDMGRIIGKDGRIIKATRELLRAYGAKDKKKVSVLIEEEK